MPDKMSPNERRAEFNRLFDSIPAERNIERLRKVAGILHYKIPYLRILRMREAPRTIPESKLLILREALEREAREAEAAKAAAGA